MPATFVLSVTVLLAAFSSLGHALSYPEPPKYFVEGSRADNLFIRKNNHEEVIEVRTADTFDLVWSVKVNTYQTYTSVIELSADGKYLYHVISNGRVHSVDSTCVEVYSEKGLAREYKIRDFSNTLSKNTAEHPVGGSPRHLWRTGRTMVQRAGIAVELYDGGYASFPSATSEIVLYEHAYPYR